MGRFAVLAVTIALAAGKALLPRDTGTALLPGESVPRSASLMSTLEHGRLHTFPVTRLKGIRWWQNFNSGGSSGAKCAGFCSLEKNRANASAIVATCEIPSCEECAMCSDVDMACPHSCDTQAQCNYRGTGDSSECSKCDYCTGCPFWCDEVGECPGADEHPRWASQGDERCANCLMCLSTNPEGLIDGSPYIGSSPGVPAPGARHDELGTAQVWGIPLRGGCACGELGGLRPGPLTH